MPNSLEEKIISNLHKDLWSATRNIHQSVLHSIAILVTVIASIGYAYTHEEITAFMTVTRKPYGGR